MGAASFHTRRVEDSARSVAPTINNLAPIKSATKPTAAKRSRIVKDEFSAELRELGRPAWLDTTRGRLVLLLALPIE